MNQLVFYPAFPPFFRIDSESTSLSLLSGGALDRTDTSKPTTPNLKNPHLNHSTQKLIEKSKSNHQNQICRLSSHHIEKQ